jgi:sucrose phosphorylase
MPQLIAYADRFGGSVSAVNQLLSGPLKGAFGGVHLLPFYVPYDGIDAGFDPEDHTEIDPRLGSWDDLRELSSTVTVMAYVIINHMSAKSVQFRDFLANGDESATASMFLTLGSVFPDGATEEDLAKIYRPRPGLPFTAIVAGGRRRLAWTTFTSDQIDLNLRERSTWEYLGTIVDRLVDAGVSQLRLDAIGYTGKTAGTNCFMTAETGEVIARIRDYAHARGAQVLVEVHAPYRIQTAVARDVDYVYDFALPPLILHGITSGDAVPLAAWLAIRPANSVTVLDTHDGIGIVDVGADPDDPTHPALLTPAQIDDLVNAIHRNSGGSSRRATGAAASNLDLYQVNCTFYDALGASDTSYLLARLIQLFVPGVPQIYYVGLLAGRNDLDLLSRSGIGRDVNRHSYAWDEIMLELERDVVRSQLNAIRFRAHHPAFQGAFSYDVAGPRLVLSWVNGVHEATLSADVSTTRYTITFTANGYIETVDDAAALVAGRPHGTDGP